MPPGNTPTNGWKQWAENITAQLTQLRQDQRDGMKEIRKAQDQGFQDIWHAIDDLRKQEREGAIQIGKVTVKIGVISAFFGTLGGILAAIGFLLLRAGG